MLYCLFYFILLSLTFARIHALAIRATARPRPSPPPRHRGRRLARRVGSSIELNNAAAQRPSHTCTTQSD
eukprot:5834487-Pleurochrysis_carterae.AAC.2